MNSSKFSCVPRQTVVSTYLNVAEMMTYFILNHSKFSWKDKFACILQYLLLQLAQSN